MSDTHEEQEQEKQPGALYALTKLMIFLSALALLALFFVPHNPLNYKKYLAFKHKHDLALVQEAWTTYHDEPGLARFYACVETKKEAYGVNAMDRIRSECQESIFPDDPFLAKKESIQNGFTGKIRHLVMYPKFVYQTLTK